VVWIRKRKLLPPFFPAVDVLTCGAEDLQPETRDGVWRMFKPFKAMPFPLLKTGYKEPVMMATPTLMSFTVWWRKPSRIQL